MHQLISKVVLGATKFVRIRAIRVYLSETLARAENRKFCAALQKEMQRGAIT